MKEELRGVRFKTTRSRYIYVQERSPGVHGWLGLNDNDTYLPEVLILNPVVGVVHDRVQEQITELNPEFDRRGQPLVSQNLGYLMPEKTYRTWDFYQQKDPRGPAAELAAALSAYGSSFIDTWADWSDLSERIEHTDLLTDDEKYVVIPVVRALNGDLSGALRMVDGKHEQIGHSQDLYASFYRKYAESFVKKFG
ncbi:MULTISPECIES: hypothetical protein [unclassified Nonomuraea]|uniref:hypothetical protein n=1 Tax=unclassified Nonomuraea TaxID=2593643 RepID=UPI0034211CD7